MANALIHQLTLQQLLFVITTGTIPSLLWLLFWLRRDRSHPEPFSVLFFCFILGAGMVFLAGPLEGLAKQFTRSDTERIAVWAAIEEVLKFLPVAIIALRSVYNDEPIDPAIYMITTALGFAALENSFYILQPFSTTTVTATLLTGSLRFFGSTLLHSIASSFVGIAIGLSPKGAKGVGALLGLAGATFLHTTFNIFILKNTSASFLQIYGYLWVSAIICFMVMEKLRRIPLQETSVAPSVSPIL